MVRRRRCLTTAAGGSSVLSTSPNHLPCQFRPPSTYGQVATGYDNSRRVEPAVAVAMVEALHSLRARSVLEIGAGTGNYTGALMASGLSVIPLDRSRTMVEIGAQKTFAPWILADAAALPLRRASVDAIAGVNVLHHLPALPVALAEFRRVARAGAVLQVVVRESPLRQSAELRPGRTAADPADAGRFTLRRRSIAEFPS